MFGMVVPANWLTLPMVIWRIIIGPIHLTKIYWGWVFVMNAYTYIELLSAAECLMIKFLSLVVFKRLLPIQDDIFARFLLVANICLSLFLSLVNCYSLENIGAEKRFLGMPTDMVSTIETLRDFK